MDPDLTDYINLYKPWSNIASQKRVELPHYVKLKLKEEEFFMGKNELSLSCRSNVRDKYQLL